jgi:hypothetical protein
MTGLSENKRGQQICNDSDFEFLSVRIGADNV